MRLKLNRIINRAALIVASTVFCGALIGDGVVAEPATQPSIAPSTQPSELPLTEIPADVAALIAKLNDPAWKERQRAQDALVAMGSNVVSALQQSLEGNLDPEIRHRIENALVKIDQISETGASSITMDLKDVTAKEFFTELSKQIRAEMQPSQPQMWDNNTFTKQSIKLENASFWQTMKVAQEKFGIELAQWGEGIRIAPNGQGGQTLRGPSITSGPFMIVAQQVFRSQTVDLVNGGGTQDDFYVRFMGFAEPKLRIMQASSDMQIDEAIDDNGNSLIVMNNPRQVSYGGGMAGAWTFNARIRYPADNPGHKIAKLKGSIPVILQTGYETWDIEDPLSQKNAEKMLGNMKFVMKSLVKNADHYTLQLAINVNPENYNRIQGILNNNLGNNSGDLKLVDENGQGYFAQSRATNNTNGMFEATIDFVSDPYRRPNRNTQGIPTKLTIRVPTQTKNISIPIEFKDLPIP